MNRITLVVLLALSLLLAACGERDDPAPAAGAPEKLDLTLDFFPNADHAGIYAAIGTGAFEDVRLEVTPRTPADPSAPLKLLAAGRTDLAISYQPEVMLARDRGLKVVAIAAIAQTPLTSLISLGKDGVKDPRDLEGKRIGTAGIPYQDAYLKAILAKAGVDEGSVSKVNVGFNFGAALVSKKVDATLGPFWNYEGIQLERDGRDPQILRVEELGIPTYNELVVVAREQDARENGQRLRRFLLGLARGHRALRDDPEAGVGPLLKADRNLDAGLQRAVVEATLPVFFPRDTKRPFGWMDREAWRSYGRWMVENDLLKQPEQDPARALTTEFLPGEGPQPDS